MKRILPLVALFLSLVSAEAGQKFLWMELIGFDNAKADYGVGALLGRMPVKPDGVSILFTEPEIVNGYRGLERDYPIGDAHCSYCARPWNEERRRQSWTAHQLRGLVAELKRHGVEAYPSFFEWTTGKASSYWKLFGATRIPHAWLDDHPEIGYVMKDGRQTSGVCVIKRFADGTYYEDFFARQIVRFCRDFGFAGFHASDGYGHSRHALDAADFSDDVLEQFVRRNPDVALPAGSRQEKADWILAHARAKWCRFYAVRHAEFLGKVAKALHAEGLSLRANTSWTRDPLEALYRYGEDYRLLERAGVDGFVSESSATVLEIEGWNPDTVSMIDRCRATLLRTGAAVRTPIAHLACIKDGMEQYSSLRHAPTRMVAEVIGLAALFSGERKIANDVLWCLADGITAEEWRKLDALRALLPPAAAPEGVRVVWNDAANDRELEATCADRSPSSFRLLALLLHGGAAVSAAVRTDEALKDETLPLLILNPAHYPADVLAALRRRTAPVVEFGLGADGCVPGPVPTEPDPTTWTQPLPARELPAEAFARAIRAINAVSPVRPDEKGMEDLRVMSYRAADGARIVVAISDRSTYLNAKILVKGSVAAVKALTADPSLPVGIKDLGVGETRLSAKIPPAGVVVLKVTAK